MKSYSASKICGKYRALKILDLSCGGLISSQLVVKIFGSSWLLGGSVNPKTRGFSKMKRGNIAPPQDRVWKCSFTIFDEGLGGKAGCLLQILNVLVFSDQMNHIVLEAT